MGRCVLKAGGKESDMQEIVDFSDDANTHHENDSKLDEIAIMVNGMMSHRTLFVS